MRSDILFILMIGAILLGVFIFAFYTFEKKEKILLIKLSFGAIALIGILYILNYYYIQGLKSAFENNKELVCSKDNQIVASKENGYRLKGEYIIKADYAISIQNCQVLED